MGQTLLELWDSVWIALFASGLLYGCYRAVEWRWPERYLGMHATFGLPAQETWIRFVTYRVGPTYVFAATCCVIVDRVGGFPLISVVVLWALSVALTHGRVIIRGLIDRTGEVNYAGYHILMLVLLSGTIAVAYFTTGWWGTLVPSPEEFLAAAWSGLIVAGLGGLVLYALRPRDPGAPQYGPAYFVERAERDVGIGTFDRLFEACMRTGADPLMLKALLVVEAVQRPRWLRTIERWGVRLGVARTSGVMQMGSARPLSDDESVDLAARDYAGIWCLRQRGSDEWWSWDVDLGEMWGVLTRHNADGRFASQVKWVAEYLLSAVAGYHLVRSEGAPIVLELRRYPERFALRGITRAPELTFLELNGHARFGNSAAPDGAPKRGWWAWEFSFSPSARTVFVGDRASGFGMALEIEDGEIRDFRVLNADELQSQPSDPVG